MWTGTEPSQNGPRLENARPYANMPCPFQLQSETCLIAFCKDFKYPATYSALLKSYASSFIDELLLLSCANPIRIQIYVSPTAAQVYID